MASLSNTLQSLAVTGNASAINGLTPVASGGTTTPNPSTRPTFQQSVALLNSPSTVGGNLASSSLTADAALTSLASTITGQNQNVGGSNFNGSSAISAANILGILNSDIVVGGNVGSLSGSTLTLGTISSTATGSADSTASTVTGDSAAAVVDLAGAGLFNSLITVGQSASALSFSANLTGNASASGVTVGSVTSPSATAPSLSTALDGTGVNSILNLNARGLSPQTQYFQDPISPFFAEFSGLPTDPNTFGSNALFNDTTASTATGIAVTGQAAFNGQVLFDATTGEAITGIAVGSGFSNAVDINGVSITSANVTSVAIANQLIDSTGELLFTTAPSASTPIAATFTSPAGSGDITIGQNGDVNASAGALGSSVSSNTTGDTNAFASVFSAGATLVDNIVIGRDGDITGSSNVGFDPTAASASQLAPIETSSTTTTGSSSALTNILSIGLGTSAVRDAIPTSDITPAAGSTAGGSIDPISPALLSIGRDGNISSTARAFSSTSSQTTTGDAVAFTGGLTGTGGNTFATTFSAGNALTVGLFNLDINGVGHNNVTSSGFSGFTTQAQTVTGDATGSSTSITAGIFGNDTSNGAPANTTLDVVNGNVSGSATALNLVDVGTITGNASGIATDIAVGIGNTTLGISNNGNVSGIAQAVNAVRANTITGNASAVSSFTATGISNTPIVIGGSGSITASADLTSMAGTLPSV